MNGAQAHLLLNHLPVIVPLVRAAHLGGFISLAEIRIYEFIDTSLGEQK